MNENKIDFQSRWLLVVLVRVVGGWMYNPRIRHRGTEKLNNRFPLIRMGAEEAEEVPQRKGRLLVPRVFCILFHLPLCNPVDSSHHGDHNRTTTSTPQFV